MSPEQKREHTSRNRCKVPANKPHAQRGGWEAKVARRAWDIDKTLARHELTNSVFAMTCRLTMRKGYALLLETTSLPVTAAWESTRQPRMRKKTMKRSTLKRPCVAAGRPSPRPEYMR